MVQNLSEIEKYNIAQNSPGFLLWQLQTIWQRNLNQVLAKFSITHAQFLLLQGLAILSEVQTEGVTQSLLSNFIRLDPMSTSKAIRLLEEKKLVNRTDSKRDQRAKDLVLTPEGSRVLTQVQPLVLNSDREFFSYFSKDKYLEKFESLLIDLVENHRRVEVILSNREELEPEVAEGESFANDNVNNSKEGNGFLNKGKKKGKKLGKKKAK